MEVLTGVLDLKVNTVRHYFQARLVQPEFLFNTILYLTKHLEYYKVPLDRCIWSTYSSIGNSCTVFVVFELTDTETIEMVTK